MIISTVFSFFAGIANAIMDISSEGKFKNVKKPNWWNKDGSWVNKWKKDENGKPISGKEKFPLSSTALVFTTDAWHFFQMVMLTCFALAIVTYSSANGFGKVEGSVWIFIIDFAIARIGFWLGFNPVYNFLKKKYKKKA